MTVKQFSKSLVDERERLGVTQAEAARICGVSVRALAGWEIAESPKLKEVLMEGVLARLKNSKVSSK